jgi:hypothetical protein
MQRRLLWLVPLFLIGPLLPSIAVAARPGPLSEDTAPNSSVRDIGNFVARCRFSQEAPDDPIVHAGHQGASHLHTFFGNVTTDADSIYATLRAGGTTCLMPEDASGYWVPALYQNGSEVRPRSVTVYYRTTPLTDPTEVQPFPAGLKYVAGDASATSPQPLRVTGWSCLAAVGRQSTTPLDCLANQPLNLHVRFPSCWDGINTDSPDHRSHLAYVGRQGCPATHPVVVPRLAMIVHYPISGDPGTITLASGSVYSAHADFFSAWDQTFLTDKVNSCLRTSTKCGAV